MQEAILYFDTATPSFRREGSNMQIMMAKFKVHSIAARSEGCSGTTRDMITLILVAGFVGDVGGRQSQN
jgi:hypothetical protein